MEGAIKPRWFILIESSFFTIFWANAPKKPQKLGCTVVENGFFINAKRFKMNHVSYMCDDMQSHNIVLKISDLCSKFLWLSKQLNFKVLETYDFDRIR